MGKSIREVECGISCVVAVLSHILIDGQLLPSDSRLPFGWEGCGSEKAKIRSSRVTIECKAFRLSHELSKCLVRTYLSQRSTKVEDNKC